MFKSYVGLPPETTEAVKNCEGWYTNLGDIGFWLPAAATRGPTESEGGFARELYW